MNKNKGFTIIELLIVVAIIALLVTLVIVSLRGSRIDSRDSKRLADLKQIQNAIELYFIDEATPRGYPVPSTWEEFFSILEPYMSGMPTDPNSSGDYYYWYFYKIPPGGTIADEYVLRAKIEDENNEALLQDNDTANVVATEWNAVGNFIYGVSSSANGIQSSISCLDTGGANYYCLTE